MNEVTLSKMKQMKLYGMHGAFKTAIETGKTDDYTIDQFTSMMIDAEFDDRNNRKIERAIKYARFHYKASVENIIYETARNIDKTKLAKAGTVRVYRQQRKHTDYREYRCREKLHCNSTWLPGLY